MSKGSNKRKVEVEINVKSYKMLSNVILTICFCGIILAIINSFTGMINSSIQTSGTVICILGFIVAGSAIILLENEKIKKEKKK